MVSEKQQARMALQEKLYRLSSIKKNMGASALSKHIGVSRSKAEAWFKGRTFPSEDLQSKIAEFYNVTADQLFNIDNPDIFDYSTEKAEILEEAAQEAESEERITRILRMNPNLTREKLENDYDIEEDFLENGELRLLQVDLIEERSHTSRNYESLGRKPKSRGRVADDLNKSSRKIHILNAAYLMMRMDQEQFDKVLDFIEDITDNGKSISDTPQ